MTDRPESKRKKSLKLLTKLLNAAHEAQEKGKYLALEKIIKEANKISANLGKTRKATFKLVDAEVMDDSAEKKIVIDYATEEEKIFRDTQSDLKPEHNNLAIIAAKRDFFVE